MSETEELKEPTARLQGYLDAIAKYDREFKKWETRVSNILKRYRDEDRQNSDATQNARFNILWSNVQILVPATFARIPQPDVSRRFRDQDRVGRVAALLLERGLEFETQHYPDFKETMTQCVHDRFLGGRGTAWIRYEPHFKPAEAPIEAGEQITEDVEAAIPQEQIDYECAPVDYVHWKDFGHSIARTWEEVTLVWRKVYMSESAVQERFGEDIAKKIPYDSTPTDLKRTGSDSQSGSKQQACIFELWDKEEGCAVWFSKSMKEFLDEKDDPLKLHNFFPTPKPLYATMTNETLVPVPDFTLYIDQANTLDTLSDRASGLVQMLQLKGVYDASADRSLARLFTEGNNGTLMPVKNWAAFAEKNGLKGQVDVYDLTPIVRALEAVYVAADQQKQQVYEIMGISDIVRGASNPNETLGAQEMKGQYASMRLRAMQSDVSRFATDILQMKAQVMCSKFNPQTLVAISAAEQLSEVDKSMVYLMSPPSVDTMTQKPVPPKPVPGPDGKPIPQGPAVSLLVGQERLQNPEAESPNPLRAFRIEVNADSMIQMNEGQEKQDRMEFLTANATFMEKAAAMAANAGPQAPIIIPLIMDMWKFGVTSFKVGKTIEGQFDEATEKLKAAAAQPQKPKPDPEMMKIEAQRKADQQKMQMDQQKQAHEAQMAQAEEKRTQMVEMANHQREQQKLASDEKLAQQTQAYEQRIAEMELAKEYDFKRWEAQLDADTKIQVAQISADAKEEQALSKPDSTGATGKRAGDTKGKSAIDKIGDMHSESMASMGASAQETRELMKSLLETQGKLLAALSASKEIVRGPDGRAVSLRVVNNH